jgi:hypothetical protein
MKHTGKTKVKVTREELGGRDASDGQWHGAESEDLGQERNAEQLEAGEHSFKVP